MLTCEACAGVRVESVTGPLPGQPGQVRVAGGQTISASQAVVVATEAPAARALLGEAMTASDSKTEEAVGTANLYFRCAIILSCAGRLFQAVHIMHSRALATGGTSQYTPVLCSPSRSYSNIMLSSVSKQDWQECIMEVHAMCKVPLQCAAAAERRECAVPEW